MSSNIASKSWWQLWYFGPKVMIPPFSKKIIFHHLNQQTTITLQLRLWTIYKLHEQYLQLQVRFTTSEVLSMFDQ